MNWLDKTLEKNTLPDWLVRAGIRRLLTERTATLTKGDIAARIACKQQFIEDLRRQPLAINTEAANEQHYEVPSRFYQLTLGRRLKYSSGLWSEGVRNLDGAEEAMLELTTQRADLQDGQDILELG